MVRVHPTTESDDGQGAVDGELPLLMIRAAKAMVADVDARADRPKKPGMTSMHAIAARYVDDHDDVTTTELAEHLGVTKQSASEIVTLLEREGYVRRRPHPVDGRSRIVELTDEGEAGLARSRARWEAVVRGWAGLAGTDDLAALRRALEAYLGEGPVTPG